MPTQIEILSAFCEAEWDCESKPTELLASIVADRLGIEPRDVLTALATATVPAPPAAEWRE